MQERVKLQYIHWGKIAVNDSAATVNGWLSVLTAILMCREGVEAWWQGRCVILLNWSFKCFVSCVNMNIDPVGGIFWQGLAHTERGAKDKSFAVVYHDFCTKFEDLL